MTGQVLGLALQTAIVLGVGSDPEQPTDTVGVRMAIFSGCVTCFVFSLFGVVYLKDRKGPDIEKGQVLRTLWMSARRSFATLDLARRELPEMFKFLGGRTAYWVAVNTLVYCGPLYLQREFGMQTSEIAPGLVVFMLTGISAVVLFRVIVKGSAGRTRVCLRSLTVAGLLIPFYLLLGMRQRWEMYPLFIVAAFEVSPFAGLCRALLSEMTPDGYASTVMALEGTLEYCTTWVGPFIVAGIITASGSMRWGVFGMLLPMIIGLPFLWRVDMEKAREERKRLEQAVEDANSAGAASSGDRKGKGVGESVAASPLQSPRPPMLHKGKVAAAPAVDDVPVVRADPRLPPIMGAGGMRREPPMRSLPRVPSREAVDKYGAVLDPSGAQSSMVPNQHGGNDSDSGESVDYDETLRRGGRDFYGDSADLEDGHARRTAPYRLIDQ